ncbi:MAG TPA: aldo/keto reductase [Allosphingosinicella sp.]|nr:aldo/keto reductase [Allosphingosinicella sp.]
MTLELGNSGLRISRLVLGGNVFGWNLNGDEAFRVLDRFVDGGGVMIDTADIYSKWAPGNQGGESEALIGDWLRRSGRRGDVLIATKVGFDEGLSASTIERGIEASLKRLGTDHVDLYFSHKDDQATPFEETLSAFDRLVKSGKTRAIGASQIKAERLEEALEVSRREGLVPYSVLQTEYNLMDRKAYEGPLRDVVVRHGLGMVAFYGLANGYLTGKYRQPSDLAKSPRGERSRAYMEGKGPAVLAALDEVAAETRATPAQVALAWLAAQPGVTAPIASATSVAQLDELLGVLDLDLSEDQVARLSAASG